MLKDSKHQLYYLIVKKNLTKKETEELLKTCEELSMKYKKQKAEGYLHFSPLLFELQSKLPSKIEVAELVEACLKQGVFQSLMREMKNLLVDG
jgi:hypothetical protein